MLTNSTREGAPSIGPVPIIYTHTHQPPTQAADKLDLSNLVVVGDLSHSCRTEAPGSTSETQQNESFWVIMSRGGLRRMTTRSVTKTAVSSRRDLSPLTRLNSTEFFEGDSLTRAAMRLDGIEVYALVGGLQTVCLIVIVHGNHTLLTY